MMVPDPFDPAVLHLYSPLLRVFGASSFFRSHLQKIPVHVSPIETQKRSEKIQQSLYFEQALMLTLITRRRATPTFHFRCGCCNLGSNY
jgi:hypothetical protein